MTAVGFEPTPLRTAALTQRLRPLGHTVAKVERNGRSPCFMQHFVCSNSEVVITVGFDTTGMAWIPPSTDSNPERHNMEYQCHIHTSMQASLAQSVARRSYNPEVVGSILT